MASREYLGDGWRSNPRSFVVAGNIKYNLVKPNGREGRWDGNI